MILVAALLLAAAPAEAIDGEAPFSASSDVFADAKAGRARLDAEVAKAQSGKYDAVRGPYSMGEDDVRVHMVRAEGTGHRIWEHRCLDKALTSRTWSHSMEAAEEASTVESAVLTAEWLKKDAPK